MVCRVAKVGRRVLMPHQQTIFDLAKHKRHAAFLLEMRLGKTILTIRTVKEWCKKERGLGNDETNYPCLVVGTSSILKTWQNELALEGEYSVVLQGRSFEKRVELAVQESYAFSGRVWILVNYESLTYTPGLSLLPWFFVGLDESPNIKNPKSKIGKICAEGFNEVEHKAILTGLVSPEGELDLFNQFYFLYKEFMGYKNFYSYRNSCFELKWNGWKVKRGYKKTIKNWIEARSFMLTRKEAGMYSKEVRETRYCKMSKDQETLYNKTEKEFATIVERDGMQYAIETNHIICRNIWLARIAGGCDAEGTHVEKWNGKAKELMYLLKGELSNEPVVIWFKHTAEIQYIAAYCKRQGIPFETLTGQDNAQRKGYKQDWFSTSKMQGRVILCQQQKVAEHGVDMSVASTAIYFSYSYSCSTIAQTKERIYHPLKKDPLLYIYLVTEGTIDEDVVFAIKNKVRSAKLFMQKMQENFLKRIKEKYGNVSTTNSSRA